MSLTTFAHFAMHPCNVKIVAQSQLDFIELRVTNVLIPASLFVAVHHLFFAGAL